MSKLDVAFKWSVTLKIIKDLNKGSYLDYPNKSLALDLGTSDKTIRRWLKQEQESPGFIKREAELKSNFGISVNTILEAKTVRELVLNLSKEVADNSFDEKKAEFYINLHSHPDDKAIVEISTHSTDNLKQIEKIKECSINTLSQHFVIPPSEPLYLNELTLDEKNTILQYYKGIISNWVPIQAKIPLLQNLLCYESNIAPNNKLDVADQLDILKKEKLRSVIRIHGPAGSGKTTCAYVLSHELSHANEHCLFRNKEPSAVSCDDITTACHELQASQKRLFLFYDTPSEHQYKELKALLLKVSASNIQNLTIIVSDNEKKWLDQFPSSLEMNNHTFYIDETRYDESLVNLYCEKINTLEMFDIHLLKRWETITHFKMRLIRKKVKLPLVMAYELTKSKNIVEKLWHEFEGINSVLAQKIYQFTLLLSKRNIWTSDEYYTSIHDAIEYRKVTDYDLLGMVNPARGALYVRDISIAKILVSQIFKSVEEEIRFTRDNLKSLDCISPDQTKEKMSRFLAEIIYRIMANTRNRDIIKDYIEDIFFSIERFITVREYRSMLYNRVATYLIQSGKEKQGLDIYKLGIKNVDSEYFYMQLARFYSLEKNDDEKALKILKECIKSNNDKSVIVITEYCRQLVEAGSISKALKWFKRTIEEFPDDPGIFTAYAMLLAQEGKTKEAISVFQKGSLGKPDTQLYTAWIKILLKSGEDRLALEVFDEAKANIIPESGIYSIIANYFFKKRDLQTAEKLCEEGLNYNPTNYHLHITSKVLRTLNKTEKALEVLGQYARKNSDPFLVSERFLLYYELQQYSLCAHTILTAQSNILSAERYLFFAEKLNEKGQYEYVEIVCIKGLEEKSTVDLVLLLSNALEAQGKTEEAIFCMVDSLNEHKNSEHLLWALCLSFTDKNTTIIINALKKRVNLKDLLLNTPFVSLLISTSHEHNCLGAIYIKVKALLNYEKHNMFAAEINCHK